MNKIISSKEKKEMTSKLAIAFGKEIKNLSKENQEILLDDIVTAFQNRIVVFNRTISQDKLNTKDNIEFHCKPVLNHLKEQ
ncbi:MAG: hypothetical protein AC479_05115 [miscellaneous Crenarchaeota group-6 archaeon AD8-1]|nr:MAG: hypothetical protein AC479_05115 [miscellaneous Crenarchaeota group-6 archaeon AD8-1]